NQSPERGAKHIQTRSLLPGRSAQGASSRHFLPFLRVFAAKRSLSAGPSLARFGATSTFDESEMATGDTEAPSISGTGGLTREEQRAVTHGDFWIPEEEREKYKRALDTLNEAGIPYVVSGAYAIYEHTGIYRETKDLDLFLDPGHIVEAARVLRAAGFVTRLEQPHWLAKATL